VTALYAGQVGIAKQFPPDRHTKQLQRLIILGGVLIIFDPLMMSTVMLETCRQMK